MRKAGLHNGFSRGSGARCFGRRRRKKGLHKNASLVKMPLQAVKYVVCIGIRFFAKISGIDRDFWLVTLSGSRRLELLKHKFNWMSHHNTSRFKDEIKRFFIRERQSKLKACTLHCGNEACKCFAFGFVTAPYPKIEFLD